MTTWYTSGVLDLLPDIGKMFTSARESNLVIAAIKMEKRLEPANFRAHILVKGPSSTETHPRLQVPEDRVRTRKRWGPPTRSS